MTDHKELIERGWAMRQQKAARPFLAQVPASGKGRAGPCARGANRKPAPAGR